MNKDLLFTKPEIITGTWANMGQLAHLIISVYVFIDFVITGAL